MEDNRPRDPQFYWRENNKSMDYDPVNRPKHYLSHPSGIEPIDFLEYFSYTLGNAVKYIWRADEKGHALEDLKKAEFYLKREIAKREREAVAVKPCKGGLGCTNMSLPGRSCCEECREIE